MSKLDRAQVQSIIANIDTDFQPIVLSSALLAFEIREVFHVRGRLFAEKKGQFIDAADQLIKAAGLHKPATLPTTTAIIPTHPQQTNAWASCGPWAQRNTPCGAIPTVSPRTSTGTQSRNAR